MRTIRISEEVWNEIAKRGKFGETADIVLKKVFSLDQSARDNPGVGRSRGKFAKDRLTARIEGDELLVRFASGVSRTFSLTEKTDRIQIAELTSNVMDFVKMHGGTIGQINAARKALTDAGFHITK